MPTISCSDLLRLPGGTTGSLGDKEIPPMEVDMKPASLVAVLVFSLVAVAHLLRLISQTDVLIGGATLPMWVSGVGLIVAGGLAVALWREGQAGSR